MGTSWQDHISNKELMTRSGQEALWYTVAPRRRRFIGHILMFTITRPASVAVEWKPDDGRRKRGSKTNVAVYTSKMSDMSPARTRGTKNK